MTFLEVLCHAAVVGDLAGDELAGERGFEDALEEALQRACAIGRIVAFAGDVFRRSEIVPILRRNASLLDDPLRQRPINVAVMWIGNRETIVTLGHERMRPTMVRPNPASRSQPAQHLAVLNGLGHGRLPCGCCGSGSNP